VHYLQEETTDAIDGRSSYRSSFLFQDIYITGIDYAGPFEIKNYTGRASLITRVYVCVFVCFSTKAIHLEPTSDLTTEKFLVAFARFVAKRGCPQRVHSDMAKPLWGQRLYFLGISCRRSRSL